MRFLRRLVTVLTLVMIGGLVTVIALLVIRLQAPAPAVPQLPDTISLPAGVSAEAVTFGAGWVAVIAGDRILVFDAGTGDLRQEVVVDGLR